MPFTQIHHDLPPGPDEDTDLKRFIKNAGNFLGIFLLVVAFVVLVVLISWFFELSN